MKIFMESYQPIERLTNNKVMGISDDKVIISDKIETLLHKVTLPNDFLCNTPGYFISNKIVDKNDINRHKMFVTTTLAIDNYIIESFNSGYLRNDRLFIDITDEEKYNNEKIYLHIVYDNKMELLDDGIFYPSETAKLVQVIEQRSTQEANVYIGHKVDILSVNDLVNFVSKEYIKIKESITKIFTIDTVLDICPGARVDYMKDMYITKDVINVMPVFMIDVKLCNEEGINHLLSELELEFSNRIKSEGENYLFVLYTERVKDDIYIYCKYKEVVIESKDSTPLFFSLSR